MVPAVLRPVVAQEAEGGEGGGRVSYVFILLAVSSGWGHRGNKSPSLSPLKKVRMQSNSSFFRDRSLKVHGFPGIAEGGGGGRTDGGYLQ